MKKEDDKQMLWLLNCNMKELLQKAIEEDWKQSQLDSWTKFKIAQFLEKIAFHR